MMCMVSNCHSDSCLRLTGGIWEQCLLSACEMVMWSPNQTSECWPDIMVTSITMQSSVSKRT